MKFLSKAGQNLANKIKSTLLPPKDQELSRQMKKAFSQPIQDKIELSTKPTSNTPKNLLINFIDRFLPKVVKKSRLNPEDITDDNLILVRMTNFAPENGVINSVRDATRDNKGIGAYRNSLHFTLNHAVKDNNVGYSWDGLKYGVVMPFDKTVMLNGKGKFIGGNPVDLFTSGSVKIPKGSILVRHNPNIPKGKLRIVNSDKIKEFKNLKGIKVVDTPNSANEITDIVISAMGYEKKSGNTSYGWSRPLETKKDIDDLIENMNGWKRFARQQGIKDGIHLYTPSARAEHIIEGVELLTQENSWRFVKQGENLLDYQKVFLDTLAEVKKKSHEGYKLSFNLETLKKIIKNSNTPKEAMKKINSELKLKPIVDLSQMQLQVGNRKLTSAEIYGSIEVRVGISDEARKLHSATLEFYRKGKIALDDLIELERQASLTKNPML